MATAKLCQIVAAEKGRKGELDKQINTIYHRLQKPDLFTGQHRAYRPLDEENGTRLPDERQVMQARVPDLLDELATTMTALFDITATKDYGNQVAKANVVVDGRTLVHDAPVSFLLWLEKRLVDLRTILGKIPTHDPAIEWTWDDNTDTYRAAPTVGIKTEKQIQSFEKAPPTDKHPAQVETYWKDVPIGEWTTTKFSGALPVRRVRQLTERVAQVLAAVQYARQEANSQVVEDERVGKAIFDFVLAP